MLIRRLLLSFLLLIALPVSAAAQWGYVGYAQITVDNTAGGVPFPSAEITDSSHMRPTQVFCFLEDGDIRWTVDGTAPTTTVGNLATAESALPAINGTALLSNFRAIRTGGTSGNLSCNFFAGGSLPFREWGIGGPGGSGGGGIGLLTSDPDDASIAAGQTNSNVNGFTMWYDGTVWRRMTVGTAGAPSGHVLTVQGITSGTPLTVTANAGTGWGTDPCTGPKLDVAIDTATSGNVELVPLSGSTVVYVCGFNFIVDSAVDVQFISGTGTACATGETNKTGAYHLTAASTGNREGFAGSYIYKTSAGQAACIELSGNVGVRGLFQYVQQ